MDDDKATDAVRTALAALNSALADAADLGIEAEVFVDSLTVINRSAPQQIVAIHLRRSRTEVEVRL